MISNRSPHTTDLSFNLKIIIIQEMEHEMF